MDMFVAGYLRRDFLLSDSMRAKVRSAGSAGASL